MKLHTVGGTTFNEVQSSKPFLKKGKESCDTGDLLQYYV